MLDPAIARLGTVPEQTAWEMLGFGYILWGFSDC